MNSVTGARRKLSPSNAAGVGDGLLDVALWAFVALTVSATPLIVSVTGHESFRAPKEYLLRAGSIIILAALAIRYVYFPQTTTRVLAKYRSGLALTAGILIWTAICTVFSTNTSISVWSCLRVYLCVGFFIGALTALRSRRLTAIYALLVPAVINTVFLLLQVSNVWHPFYRGVDVQTPSALIGNSNDVGAYLLIAAIAATALAVAADTRKLLHVAIAVFLATGILAARSAAAIGAYVIALVVMAALVSLRKAATVVIASLLIMSVVVAGYPPLRDRALSVRNAVSSRDYNLLASYRLTAFVAAAQMCKTHPLIGVGPGCYAWEYFDYKIGAEQTYAILRQPGDHKHFMFGEAHSDHLQLLAVSGMPGYSLFIMSLVLLGMQSFTQSRYSETDKQRLSHFCSLPMAVGLGMLTCAQFPLELAACTVSLLYIAAMCVSWNVRESL